MSRHTAQRKIRKICRILRSLSPDELTKEGALDEGFLAEARAKTMQQEREEVYAACFHCLVEQWKDCEKLKPKPKEKWIFVDTSSDETKHRTEWCAEADRNRCMRCGRGSKYIKMPRKCTGPRFLSKGLEKLGKTTFGRS